MASAARKRLAWPLRECALLAGLGLKIDYRAVIGWSAAATMSSHALCSCVGAHGAL